MKKFNWKALLIAVLALVLVVALVACNPKEDPNNNPPTPSGEFTPVDFFDDLWTMTKGIGDEKIAGGHNVYLNADLEIELGTGYAINDPYQSFALGLKLEGVLDRDKTHTGTDNKTVIKLNLYTGNTTFCAISLQASDPTHLYIDFGGQKIKLPLEVVAGGTNYNDKLTDGLFWLLDNDFDASEEGEFTINNVIDSLSGDMGSEWDLDDFVNGILALTPFTPQNIIDLLNGNTLLKGLSKYILDDDGNVSIYRALTSDVGAGLFKATKKNNVYTATLSKGLADMITGFIGTTGTDSISIALSYEKTAQNTLKDGVTITAEVANNAAEELIDEDGDEVNPFISIKIKDLEFGDATTNATAHQVTIPTGEYKTDVAVSLSEKLSFDGVKLNAEALKDIEFSFQASLDLENETNNKTKAEAYLSYGDAKLLHATYTGGRLAVTIDRSEGAQVAGYPVIDMLVQAFGDTAYNWLKDTFFEGNANDEALKEFADKFFTDESHTAVNTAFKGAVWTGIDIKELYNFGIGKLVDLILSKIPGAPASAAEEAAAFDMHRLLPTVYEAFRAVGKLDKGTIQLASTDVLQTVIDIANTFFNYKAGDKKAWSKDGCYTEIENMVVNTVVGAIYKDATVTDDQKAEVRQMIENQLEEVLTGEDSAYAHVTIDGVEIDLEDEPESYLTFVVKTVMETLDGKVTLDFTSGLGLKVEAGFAGATVTSETKLGMLAGLEVTDLAEDVTTDTAGWSFWDLTELFASLNTPAAQA